LWVQKFLPIFVFLSIILATDMSPKDVDFGLVSEKNLGQKNRPIWWGQVKVAKKMQKHPHL